MKPMILPGEHIKVHIHDIKRCIDYDCIFVSHSCK